MRQKMQAVVVALIVCFICTFIAYLGISFVCLTCNVTAWSWLARLALVLIAYVIFCYVSHYV